MREQFSFDVFLSHSAKDQAVVRAVAERLRADGLRDWLKRANEDGETPVKHIDFRGERFDAMSVRRWREKVLAAGGRGH